MGAPNLSTYEGYTVITNSLVTLIKQTTLVEENNIFTYAPANFNGYPAVVVVPDDENASAIDTARNKYIFKYKIMVVQSRLNLVQGNLNASYAAAETLVQALIDELTVILNTDITVGGLPNTWSRPVNHSWGYIKAQDVDARSCIMDIEVVVGQ
jgi:hypothetical protein